MAYATYEDYTYIYFGNVVPESDFPRLAERASEEIDSMTNDRLTDWLPEKELDVIKIKKACCSLAESLFYREQLATAGMASVGQDSEGKGKIISSISSGSESISYATGGTSASSLEGIVIQKLVDESSSKATKYLSGIEYKNRGYTILFRGVGYE